MQFFSRPALPILVFEFRRAIWLLTCENLRRAARVASCGRFLFR